MANRGLAGIHHVKIAVTDLGRSLRWYRRVFGLRPTMQFPEADGVVRGFSGLIPGVERTMVSFRVNPTAAQGNRGFDPVSFGVDSRADLAAWVEHLDRPGHRAFTDRGSVQRVAAHLR